ncbi:MAG: dehydrogenase [Herbinix sp.]|nr:dehydrogenase [Herbinix sp.]
MLTITHLHLKMEEYSMKLRVGMVGCGMITQKRHAPEYAENKNVEIYGFFDNNEERAFELVKQYGGKIYHDTKEMFDDSNIDAISICTPNHMHSDLTIAALKAGKHVLCEKPMALSLQESSEMILAAEATGKILMIGHNQRLLPAHRKAKEVLESGQLGRILFFQSNFKHSGPENWGVNHSNSTWFFNKAKAQFGVLGDLGSHKLDIIRYLITSEVEEIFTTALTVDKRYDNGEFIDIEDTAISLFRMRNGLTGYMNVSWCNYGSEDNSTVIYCENGVMKIYGDFPEDMVLEMKDGSKIRYQVGGIATNSNQLRSGIIDEFIDAILKNRTPLITGNDGHNTLAVIVAGLKSADTGEWEKVDYSIIGK